MIRKYINLIIVVWVVDSTVCRWHSRAAMRLLPIQRDQQIQRHPE